MKTILFSIKVGNEDSSRRRTWSLETTSAMGVEILNGEIDL